MCRRIRSWLVCRPASSDHGSRRTTRESNRRVRDDDPMISAPDVTKRIPITAPWLDDEELEAVARPLKSGWLTQGPEVAAFEHEFADYVGARHACAVSNCTTALHLALLALGVGPGDEVITVSHSFIATANAIRYCGATPVFVDIDPTTLNMNPEA